MHACRSTLEDPTAPEVAENTTAVLTVMATDADVPAQTVTFSITGGADEGLFSITSGGVLTFDDAPDFEDPTDANTDNVYLVQVTADDGNGGTTAQDLSVTVTAVNDNNPVFTSSAAPSVVDGVTTVLTVTATDADLPAQAVTFALSGGVDEDEFDITAGGALSFSSPPDFENPTDDNLDNVYLVEVTASDGNGGAAEQLLSVTVTAGSITDIRMLSATADGATTLTLTYEVLTAAATAFNIGLYRSTDGAFGGDLLLSTVSLSGGELTVGSHIKTVSIGAGFVTLPGAGASEVDTDYFLLAVADPTDAVPEDDSGGVNEDNVAAFSGVYRAGSGPVMVHGTAGVDTVTVTAAIGVTLNGGTTFTYGASSVSSVRVRTHAGNDTVNAATLTKILLAHGGADVDTLTGGTAADLLFGGADSDTLAGNGGNDSLAGEGGNDSLAGGAGSDTYLFDADGALGDDTVNDTSGTDTLDFSATGGVAVAVNLALSAAQTVNANLSLALGASTTVKNIVGGAQGDTLTGNSAANVLTGGGGDDTLTGAGGSDTYKFDADAALGVDTLVELSSGGTDTLDFASTTGQTVTVDLANDAVQVVNGNLSIDLSSASTFENVIGGSLANTLTGNSQANALTGGNSADALVGAGGKDTLFGMNGDDVLTGGGGDDTYTFDVDIAQGSDTIVETTTGGIDTLNFSPSTLQAVTVNLATAGAQAVHASNLTLTLGAGNVIENATGGSKNDTLTGNSLANALKGGAGNDALTGAAGADVLTGAGGNDTLTGGDDNDTYVFDADSSGAGGSDTLTETPTGGIDTLDFVATTGQAVTVNLATAAAQAVHASNLTLTLGAGDVFENITGGTKNDTLTGNALANVLIGGPGNDALAGGDGDDVYRFDADVALGVDTLTETNTTGGVDLLDFSPTTGLGVILDLAITTQQVLNAKLSLSLSSGAAFEMVIGTTKNDDLRGNGLANVLIGGAGNDFLDGLGGRDLLVAGAGADTVEGGDDDDILISGTLAYFNESTKVLNRAAIDALMAEWTRTNANSSYVERIANLRSGVGPGNIYKIDSSTALTDGASLDSLLGQGGLDWFWSFGADTTGDLHTGGTEAVN